MDSHLLHLLLEAALNNLIWPLDTDIRAVAMLAFGVNEAWLVVLVAAIGATVGAALNYTAGMLLSDMRDIGMVAMKPETYARWQRYGFWLMIPAGIISSYPIVNALVLGAGFLRVKPWWAALWVLIGQLIYYAWWAHVMSPATMG